jgi:hypothetical protein
MFVKKLYSAAFNISLVFGALAALLSGLSVYNRVLMMLGLFFGFLGFALCCLHIVMGQKEEDVKLSSTPLLIISLFLNSTPLLSMLLLIWLARHGR